MTYWVRSKVVLKLGSVHSWTPPSKLPILLLLLLIRLLKPLPERSSLMS